LNGAEPGAQRCVRIVIPLETVGDFMYSNLEAIRDDFLEYKISYDIAIENIIDILSEKDQLEYDDFGLPRFDLATKEAKKTINRWKAEIRSEELY
jgi:hypothetical protein